MAVPLTDGVLGGILLISLVVGAWRGLVHELMSLVGWVAAFALAQGLAQDVAQALPVWREAAAQVRYALAFVLVFVASVFAASFLSWLLRKWVSSTGLQPADRALGAMFGLARGVLVLLVLTVLVHLLGMHHAEWWLHSHLTPVLQVVLAGVKPLLPMAVQNFLP
ncbi:MAG: CvpA family protein [Betaproteobacteria bacterium]|nr:CvpA family protein [Betaproteobacteria bacterium]